MPHRLSTKNARMRLRAAVALLASLLAFVSASVRTPSLAFDCAAVETRAEEDDASELVASSEQGSAPAARSTRGVPSKAGALGATVGPTRVAIAAPPSSDDGWQVHDGSWAPEAKTHAELMVFLN